MFLGRGSKGLARESEAWKEGLNLNPRSLGPISISASTPAWGFGQGDYACYRVSLACPQLFLSYLDILLTEQREYLCLYSFEGKSLTKLLTGTVPQSRLQTCS